MRDNVVKHQMFTCAAVHAFVVIGFKYLLAQLFIFHALITSRRKAAYDANAG